MARFSVSYIKKELEKEETLLLNDVKYFLLFVITAILSTLIFYRQTQDEFAAAIILFVLWLFFWNKTNVRGKVFLLLASVVGYIHEILGVYVGWFTYLGGALFGVPIWILPGYGAIFWASYNFWNVFERTYSKSPWFSHINSIAVSSFAVLLAIDVLFLDFFKEPAFIFLKLVFAFMLFKNARELRLAYFVATFTVFDEIAGELIGTWYHPVFSIFYLMSGYVFLLWMCLASTDILRGRKKWGLMEAVGAIGFLTLFALSVIVALP